MRSRTITSWQELRGGNMLLAEISSEAVKCCEAGFKHGMIHNCMIWYTDQSAIVGVWVLVVQEESWRGYLSFVKDVINQALCAQIGRIFEQTLGELDRRRFYVHLNGINSLLADVIVQTGFVQELSVIHYVLTKHVASPLLRRPLTRTGFQPPDFTRYQKLFGDAYYPLRKEHNFLPFNWYQESPKEAHAEFVAANQRGDFAGFWEGDRLIGAYMTFEDEIDSIVVHPHFQGRGYGTMILQDCITHILRRYPQVFLSVMESNSRAQRLYEHMGFRRISWYKELVYEQTLSK